jgi:hypothetical protein
LQVTLQDVDILERIGGGFFGDVYRGKWNKSIFVALKKVRKEHLASFEGEAQTLQFDYIFLFPTYSL